MIQPAASTVASASALLSGQPAANGTPGAESGSFADLLADQPDAEGAPAPTAAASAALVAAQPNIAGTLPLTGKILPGLLPDPAATEPATGQDAPGAGNSEGQAVPTLLAAIRALRLPVTELPGSKPAAPLSGEAAAKAAQTDDGDTEAVAASAQPFGLTGLSTGAMPANVEPAPADASITGQTGQTGLPPMIEAQLLGRPLALRGTDQPAAPAPAGKAEAASADLALKIDPARVDPAATAALSFTSETARPTTGVRLRPVLSAESEAPAPTANAAAATDGSGLLASPAATVAPLVNPAMTGVAHTARPHDFAALMDRLITARDAAQTGLPQSVSVAVNHAEFGPISLQFQHDQRGLAVSLASADPDFARAVQAAIPPAAAAGSSDGAPRDNTQASGGQTWNGQGTGFGRGDASAAGSDAGQRQARSARFDAETGSGSGPALNRGAEARDAAPSRQRGIFA